MRPGLVRGFGALNRSLTSGQSALAGHCWRRRFEIEIRCLRLQDDAGRVGPP